MPPDRPTRRQRRRTPPRSNKKSKTKSKPLPFTLKKVLRSRLLWNLLLVAIALLSTAGLSLSVGFAVGIGVASVRRFAVQDLYASQFGEPPFATRWLTGKPLGLGRYFDALATQLRTGRRPPEADTIALPADRLFIAETVLDPTQRSLFDASISQIEQFDRADIYIASHVDRQVDNDSERERSISFERALHIARYLQDRTALGRNDYRWIAIGYGSDRPIVTGERTGDRQRNRRIELEIRASDREYSVATPQQP